MRYLSQLVTTLLGVAIYIGIGLQAHMVIVGEQINYDARSLGLILGWPMTLAGLAVALGAIFALCVGFAMIAAYAYKRVFWMVKNFKKSMKKRRQERESS